jgi:hypothetical protein
LRCDSMTGSDDRVRAEWTRAGSPETMALMAV